MERKIIYLDQHFISNLIKLKNKDRFYKNVYLLLTSLIEKRLIICPFSDYHIYETNGLKNHKTFENTNNLYNLHMDLLNYLSDGNRFKSPWEILTNQLMQKALKHSCKPESIHSANIYKEKLDIDSFSVYNNSTYIGFINEIFPKWQNDKNMSFMDWYKEECDGHRREMKKYLNKLNFNKKEIFELIDSDEFIRFDFVRIRSSLFAAMAEKINRNKSMKPKAITKGMYNDTEIIAGYLTLCDVIFIDKEMFLYLTNNQNVKNIINCKTKIFSSWNKDTFIDYLEQLNNH